MRPDRVPSATRSTSAASVAVPIFDWATSTASRLRIAVSSPWNQLHTALGEAERAALTADSK